MQAARGTSLSRDDSSLETTGGPRVRVKIAFGLVFAVLYAGDQLTKHLAVAHLTGEPDKQLVGDLLQLHLTRNPGAAFSTGTAYTELFSCLAVAAALVVLWLSRRLGSWWWSVAFGFLLAGVTGNLTDRLFREPGVLRGHVIDFLMLPNWPIFNVADICINVAAVMILIQAFRGIRLDGTRATKDAPTDADPGAEPVEP
jgi:signal peptidase II